MLGTKNLLVLPTLHNRVKNSLSVSLDFTSSSDSVMNIFCPTIALSIVIDLARTSFKSLSRLLISVLYTSFSVCLSFLVSFQLLIDNAIKIPITTNRISPIAYLRYLPVLLFSIRSFLICLKNLIIWFVVGHNEAPVILSQFIFF